MAPLMAERRAGSAKTASARADGAEVVGTMAEGSQAGMGLPSW